MKKILTYQEVLKMREITENLNMREKAYFKIRKTNPHIRSLDAWKYIKSLENNGVLKQVFKSI